MKENVLQSLLFVIIYSICFLWRKNKKDVPNVQFFVCEKHRFLKLFLERWE